MQYTRRVAFRGSRAAAAVVAIIGLSCGGARTTGGGHAPAAWREVTSEHFVIWTNTSPERAATLVRTMENLRRVVLGVSFFKAEIPGKSFVVAFDDLDELHQYSPPQFIAYAWSARNMLRQPVISLAAASLEDARYIVTHELTHVISFNVIPDQPAWFAEGIAGYFETVRVDEGKETVDVGVPIEGRLGYLRRGGLMPTAQMFACGKPACMDDAFYATTWALVTYLLNEHPDELVTYMNALVATPREGQAQLWGEVFPALPPAKLDHELATWIHYGKIKVFHYKGQSRDYPATERLLPEAEILAGKGLLRALFAPDRPSAPPETVAALAADATNVLANLVKVSVENKVDVERARAVAAAHPEDWRAWLIAWRAELPAAERREARDQTCRLLAAAQTTVPIEDCARSDEPDPRRAVFMAATPKLGPCLGKSKREEMVENGTIDLEIDDAGTVTSAKVAMGSAATNACIAAVLEALTFPAHHAGPYHLGMSRPAKSGP